MTPSSQAATQIKLIAHKHSPSCCDHNTRNQDSRAWDVQHTCQTAIWTGVLSYIQAPSSEEPQCTWSCDQFHTPGWCSDWDKSAAGFRTEQSMVMSSIATSDHTTFINLIITASSTSTSKNKSLEWGESFQILCFYFFLIKPKLANNMLQHNGKFSFIK